MNKIEELFNADSAEENFARGYLDYISELVKKMDVNAIGTFLKWICLLYTSPSPRDA